ncbi:hypothetical protein E2C01_044448 [Portunus trituberculatus]|uniref:Uncharacterized protein n=1 Tax=Portunus trituberculatus TaxID=210409 RepID=A0A5B7G0H4_PORTR|nr:hypothetical protein [Portunus trituberculatus]
MRTGDTSRLGTFRLANKQAQGAARPSLPTATAPPPKGDLLPQEFSLSEVPDMCPPRPRGENFCLTPYLGDTTSSQPPPTASGGAGHRPAPPSRPAPGHTPSMRKINFSCVIGDAATQRGLSWRGLPRGGSQLWLGGNFVQHSTCYHEAGI